MDRVEFGVVRMRNGGGYGIRLSFVKFSVRVEIVV